MNGGPNADKKIEKTEREQQMHGKGFDPIDIFAIHVEDAL